MAREKPRGAVWCFGASLSRLLPGIELNKEFADFFNDPNRENLKPWLVADLLILNEQMPRSLASCYENLVRFFDAIAHAYGRQGPAQRKARATRTRLQNSRMEEIFQAGLHEFIGEFVSDNNALGAAVTSQYLM